MKRRSHIDKALSTCTHNSPVVLLYTDPCNLLMWYPYLVVKRSDKYFINGIGKLEDTVSL